jgi:hypothetical protein
LVQKLCANNQLLVLYDKTIQIVLLRGSCSYVGNWCVVVAVTSGLMPFSVVMQLVAIYSNDDWLSSDFP